MCDYCGKIFPVGSYIGFSQSQCYTSSSCTGGTVPVVDAKDCCVGTNDGQSYGVGPGNCQITQCIGEMYYRENCHYIIYVLC